jgi:hypothetical protein
MTRQNGEGLEGGSLGSKRIYRVLAASTSYPIPSYPILCCCPAGSDSLSLLVLCDEGENGVSVVGESPWKGKEGGGGGCGGGVWH